MVRTSAPTLATRMRAHTSTPHPSPQREGVSGRTPRATLTTSKKKHAIFLDTKIQAAPTPSLAMHSAPHDALRLGLPALKEDAAPRHPVDEIQTTVRAVLVPSRLHAS
jgi:hypothetical protein